MLRPRGKRNTAVLTPDELRTFHRDGCVAIPRITSPAEIALLLEIFTRLFATGVGRREGAQFDMLSHEEDAAPRTLPTIINPIDYARELRDLEFRSNALHAARQLLGPRAVPSFEHVILKPPHIGAATPWHQDEAYRVDAGFEYSQVSIWMPLQDATVENGCMHYLPGSHRFGVLPHKSPGDDHKVHAIECVGDFDPMQGVSFPLPAGGATLHHGRTLHYTGPNRTDSPRFAYILAFEIPPLRASKQRSFSWMSEKRTPSILLKRQWRRRGGFVVEAWRKMRRGLWLRPRQFTFEIYRAFRALTIRDGQPK